jgi:multiple sugar transport system substrate-binding protein
MKKTLALLLALVMVFALSVSGVSASAEEPVTLTYWYWADNTEQSACMQEAVAAFNESNGKGITVVAEEYPWDSGGYIETVFNAVMGGGGPDITCFKVSGGKLFNASGLLNDMTSYVEGWEDAGQISDAA